MPSPSSWPWTPPLRQLGRARGGPSTRVTAREARRDGADPYAACGQLARAWDTVRGRTQRTMNATNKPRTFTAVCRADNGSGNADNGPRCAANGRSKRPCTNVCMARSATEASRLATGLSSRKTEKSKILGVFQQKNTFPSLRPHDKNLDPTRTFAVRRLRGSPLACTVARYLIRVLTGARRKRIGMSLKKKSDDPKNHIKALTCVLQIASGDKRMMLLRRKVSVSTSHMPHSH